LGKGPTGNNITTGDLAKYPDLAQQFDVLKPFQERSFRAGLSWHGLACGGLATVHNPPTL
jgi:hypothetical protein